MITELRTAVYAIAITVAVIIALAVFAPPAGAAARPRPCVGRIDPTYSNLGLVRLIRADGSVCVTKAGNVPVAPRRTK